MDKKYAEFMDEISRDELYEGLLAYGFFAEKLPPIFTAVPFFNYCRSLTGSFESGWNDFVTFRVMRNISIPRRMGVPNPFKYQRLCVLNYEMTGTKYALIFIIRRMRKTIE